MTLLLKLLILSFKTDQWLWREEKTGRVTSALIILVWIKFIIIIITISLQLLNIGAHRERI